MTEEMIKEREMRYFDVGRLPRGVYETLRTAPHIGHNQHLCDLAERGQISLSDMKDLVKSPKFICKKCGRAAANEENLCEPVTLD